MKFKDLLMPIALAFVTTWFIQYFFLGSYKNNVINQEGSTFIAPENVAATEPLNTEVDFVDIDLAHVGQETHIETNWARLTFTSAGATLNHLALKRQVDDALPLVSLNQELEVAKEKGAFLLAFENESPYVYTLSDASETDEQFSMVYNAKTEHVSVKKQFIIDKKNPRITLSVTVDPQEDGIAVRPRIFLPGPDLQLLAASDEVSSVVVSRENQFLKKGRAQLNIQEGWQAPHLFGSDSRYAIHALIGDDNHFTQRAYYLFNDKKLMTAILEGPSIAESKTWQMSFYCGLKRLDTINAVDGRLAQTLDYYGWFSPIASFLMVILAWLFSFLHNYGWAIIALTILIRFSLLPFTLKAEQGAKQRIEVQKKIAYIRQKYKNDPERLAKEQAEILKKHGVPGLGGCLPILVQIPIFMALSRVLANAVELYQASFLWIPNLSAKDPYYILPLLVCVAMLLQMSITSADSQQKFAAFAMAIVFGAAVSSFSAGLALYIAVSTILGVIQTVVARRLFKN